MPIDPIDLLLQQANKLEKRCDDLERRMSRFETVALAVTMVAFVLGIGAGYGALVLRSSNNKLSDFQSRLDKAQPALDSLSQLKQEIDGLKNEAGPIAKTIDNRFTAKALLGRIQRFESASPPSPYAWDGYFSDMRGLKDFAVEYTTLVGQDPEGASARELNACYEELCKAADTVKGRAKDGLKIADPPQWYEMHWNQSPQNFENLLTRLKQAENQSRGLTGAQIGCYQIAFPNWLANNGAFVGDPFKIGPGMNSPDCLRLLGIDR
jgi:hypothetical protein